MCIALVSIAHPDYSLILINNRDEFLSRPTALADWWNPPNGNILGARDLLRDEQGTWLGITKQGRIAVLTNFREDGTVKHEARSRGSMVNAFLKQPADRKNDTEGFIGGLVEGQGLKGVGGFSLVCGKVGEPLAVISNRTPNVEGITWIGKDQSETVGLSNTAIADKSWTKVTRGEQMLASAITADIKHRGSKSDFINSLFHLLSDDRLPRRPKGSEGGDFESYLKELRKSIFIPAISGEGVADTSAEKLAAAQTDQRVNLDKPQEKNDGLSGTYGTQKQTIVLVSHQDHVTFVERTLYDAMGKATTVSDRDRSFEFDIERW